MSTNSSNQSSQQRSTGRKQQQSQQMSTIHGGPVQSSNVRAAREREASPSPSLREQQQRQRYVRTQSMPIASSTQQTHTDDFDFDDSQQAPNSNSSSQQQQQGFGRPVPISRASQPQFRSAGGGQGQVQGQGQGQVEKWQMTEDLQADIDRADLLQQQQHQQQATGQRQQSHSPAGIVDVRGMSITLPTSITIPPPGTQPAPGTAGVAYAGGAASAGAAFVSASSTGGSSHCKSHSGSGISPDTLDSPGSQGTTAAARRRTVATEQAVHRASPLSYALRKTANTSPGYPGGMPSPRSLKNRTPDRSLPVQEEPDEHEQQGLVAPGSGRVTPSPAPSSDLNPTKDLDHDGEGTLVDLGDDDDESGDQTGKKLKDGMRSVGSGAGSGPGGQESTEGEGSHTPRSPTNPLYPQSHGAHAQGLIHQHHQHHRGIHEVLQPDKMHVNGGGTRLSVTSGSNSNSSAAFNPQEFQTTLKKLQSHHQPHLQSSSPYPTYPPHAPTSTHPPGVPPPPFSPFSRADFSRNESRGSYPTWMFDFYHNYPPSTAPGDEGGDPYYEYDAAAEAFMQQFLPPGSGPTYRAPSSVGGQGGYGAMGTGTGMSGSSGRGYGQARPDAPIPPTPHSQTSAPTPFRRPSQQQQQQGREHREQDGVENEDNIQNDNDNENEDNEEVVNGVVEEREHEDRDRSRSRGRDVNENERDRAQNDQSQERFAPPFSPAPPSGTPYPYPYPFSHVRRVGGYVYPRGTHPSHVPVPPPSVPIPGPVPTIPIAPPRVPSSMYDYDPNAVQEQLRLQMQMYAYNNYNNDNGAMTDSTFSTASTPYPGMPPGYTPFGAFLNQSRKIARARERERERVVNAAYNGGVPEDGRVTVASIRSSPSHQPVPLPPMPMIYGSARNKGLKRRDRLADLRGQEKVVNGIGTKLKPPPRVDSTQPRETTPEPISEVDDEDEDSGEETAGEKYEHEHREHASSTATATTPPNHVVYPTQAYGYPSYGYGRQRGIVRDDDVEEENDGGEWVDEESDEEEDLLDLEFHPSYVTNPDRRRRRWEKRWEDLVRAFQALDRETDTTLLLLASPSHTNKLYSLSSRSIRRDAQLGEGNEMYAAKGAFVSIAKKRRRERREGRMSSLIERLYLADGGVGLEMGNINGGGAGAGLVQSHSERSQSGLDEDDSPPEGEDIDNVPPKPNDPNSAAPQQSQPSSTTSSATATSATPHQAEQQHQLKRLLRTTLYSLSALQRMYEEREGRWRAEERRMREEREGVDLLLRQAFGVGVAGMEGLGGGGGMGMNGMGGLG